jgi:hypothetical protein
MVTQDHDILTRNGISIVLETDVDYNCEDNGFCRLLKELDVQTALNFTGIVGNYRTVLTSDFRNFTLNEAADFNDNVFSIVIDQGNDGAVARLSMNGVLDIESEPERNITFDTTWTFSVEPTENVTISGTRTSIYQDVFERGLFDIIEGRVGGEIDPHSRVIQFDYTSTSVVGNECYTEQEYVDWVIDDETSPETKVYEYDSMNQNEDGTLNVISDTCRVGNSLFHVYTEDLEQTQYSAQFFFTGYEDFIRVVFNTLPDDAVSTIVDHIRFPRGLTTMQQRNNVVDRDFVRFFGTNNFLGIFAYGEVDAYTHEERVEATMYMPSFTIGGGNLQFLNSDEIERWYDTHNNNFCQGRLDCYGTNGHHTGNSNNFRHNNTLSMEFDTRNMKAADPVMNSNAILFEILQRVEYTLDQDRWNFLFNGKPFRGAFDAELVVEVVPVSDIQNEDNSIVRVVLDQTDNFFKLQTLVNDLLREWTSNIVITNLEIEDRIAELTQTRDFLERTSEQYANCPETEECRDIPSIRCTEYAQNAVCVESIQTCSTVRQTCVQRQEYTYNWGTYEVCTQFDTVCDDEEPATVCVDYELQDIPDQCVAMEISCTRILVEDQSCVDTYNRLQRQIAGINERLVLLNELRELLRTLTESSICMIRVKNEDDRRDHRDCTTRDDIIDGIPERIEMLEFFSLRDTRSIMELRNVVSSDSMIFESDVSLYGDWTRGQQEGDRTIVGNELSDEREDEGRGYDLGYESLLYVNHFLDFSSVNRTAYQLSRRVREVVCRQNNLQGDRSSRVQVLLREFSLLEGNRTICPDLRVISNASFEQQVTLRQDHPSI